MFQDVDHGREVGMGTILLMGRLRMVGIWVILMGSGVVRVGEIWTDSKMTLALLQILVQLYQISCLSLTKCLGYVESGDEGVDILEVGLGSVGC